MGHHSDSSARLLAARDRLGQALLELDRRRLIAAARARRPPVVIEGTPRPMSGPVVHHVPPAPSPAGTDAPNVVPAQPICPSTLSLAERLRAWFAAGRAG